MDMEYVNVGKIVNTFGIKGELKIVSRFEMADKVFKVHNKIMINNNVYEISGMRIHKNNYLVEIDNLKDINLVEHLIGNDVFFNKADLNLGDNDYLISDLVGFVVKEDDKEYGEVTDFDDNKINPIIKINNQFYIPLKGDFILKVDKVNRIIYGKNISSLVL
ncbi:MAG: ribosome maturation factor RimM [Bacilli bacterium]